MAVSNFPTQEDAEAYATAFRIKLVDGKLFRDDGKGVEIFVDSLRDVLDSQITVTRAKNDRCQSRAWDSVSHEIPNCKT